MTYSSHLAPALRVRNVANGRIAHDVAPEPDDQIPVVWQSLVIFPKVINASFTVSVTDYVRRPKQSQDGGFGSSFTNIEHCALESPAS